MAEKRERKVPRGKAMDSSESDLDAAAEIRPDDVAAAQETARRHGRGTDLARMLEAEPMEEDTGPEGAD